jgi:hypothetical protein
MPSERRALDRETARRRRPFASTGSGLGVDRQGGPVIDPTENVRELFDAGATRQDDLRLGERRLQEEKILRVEREMLALQREVSIRADHQKDLDTLEAKRLDAVRSVDQLAVKTEADRSAAAITALANAAATTAETLRSAVNTSATNLATQLTNTVNAITERIAALEKSSYTGAGKQAVADPMMEQMLAEMRHLGAQRAGDVGKSEGIGASWGVLLGAVALVATLLTIYGGRTSAPIVPPPQVIYVPAPAGSMLPTTPPSPVPR